MKMFKTIKAAVIAVALLVPVAAHAVPVFVGSWSVGDGPQWGPSDLPAYSAQEAAALLFGGSAEDYIISTVSSLVEEINDMAWYDQYGIGMSMQAPDTTNGDFYVSGVFSAYVHDNCVTNGCENFINFAFIDDGISQEVSEPAVLGLLGAGLIGFGLARRKRA